MIKCCIFDLDGTLVDSLEDLSDTMNQILQEYHYPVHEIEKYRKFVGNGVDKLIERAFPIDKKESLKDLRKRFDEQYPIHLLDHTKPYEQIEDLIKRLKEMKITLAVVTNKPDEHAKKIVETLFPHCFLYVYGNQANFPKKPDPYFIEHIIQQLHIKKEECLYLGDSDVDMQTGKNAHVKTIGVSWGFRSKEELLQHGADGIIDKPLALLDYIRIKKIAVSSCLLGENCTYNGKNNANRALMKLDEKGYVVPICPEVLGGLTIPREPCEITCLKPLTVNSLSGNDYTKEYLLGAKKALDILKENEVEVAILKSRSPSCGKENIYDGTFQHIHIKESGICTKLLEQNGIEVYNEDNMEWLLNYIEKGEE